MYCNTNFKTKKQLKEYIKNGGKTGVYNPGPFDTGLAGGNCKVCIEGPHYPAPHTWYATVTLENGYIVKVN